MATLSGTCSGNVHVRHGGRLEMTGRITGVIVQNDGEVSIAEGAVIAGRQVAADGHLVPVTTISIVDATNRFRLVGTGSAIALSWREYQHGQSKSKQA